MLPIFRMTLKFCPLRQLRWIWRNWQSRPAPSIRPSLRIRRSSICPRSSRRSLIGIQFIIGLFARGQQRSRYLKEVNMRSTFRDEEVDKDTTLVGCWAKFINLVSSFWSTTDMSVGEDREALVRTQSGQI